MLWPWTETLDGCGEARRGLCAHGHRYEARYDEVAPEWMSRASKLAAGAAGLRESAYERRYVQARPEHL